MRVLVHLPVREASPLAPSFDGLNLVDTSTDAIAQQLTPMGFTLTCVQCNTVFTALLFRGPDRYELAIFPTVRGGLSTPHTPPNVAYYLDQAQRSESAGAFSAAMAMYRAALEHLLHEQHFTVRMLGPKIAALEAAINGDQGAVAPPRWARDLDPRFLNIMNRLANAAIHPAVDGDVSGQAILDSQLLQQVKITFAEMLLLVYERDHETKERLAALEAALTEIGSAPTSTGGAGPVAS